MVTRPFRFVPAAAVLLFAASVASAQTDVVVNGGFESGLTGWSAAPSDAGNSAQITCGFNSEIAGAPVPNTALLSFTPSGSLLAMGSILHGGTVYATTDSSCVLYQNVAIPLGATTATLKLKWGLKYIGINSGAAALLAGLFSSTTVVPYFSASSVGGISYYEPGTSDATLVSASSVSFNVSSLANHTARLVLFIALGHVAAGTGAVGGFDDVQLLVVVPPTISQSFGAASIPLLGSTSLSYTITNPAASGSVANGVAFTDTLPAGLSVSSPNGLAGSCGGGAIAAVSGTRNISLSGASLAAGDSCTFSVNVTGATAGSYTNNATVTSTNLGTADALPASLKVLVPPSITKSFGAANVPLNGNTSLTFSLTNPNASASLSGVGFTDTLPAGLIVATPNGQTGSCGGGTVTATAGAASVTLSGAALATSGSCTFAVSVTATTLGAKNNTTSAVVSTEGGTGLTASATVTVLTSDLTIAKSHTGSFIQGDSGRTYTVTVTNSGSALTAGAVSMVDTLPAGLTATAIAGPGWNCTLATLTCTRGDALAANASYPAITVTVNVAPNALGSVINTAAVSGGGETNTANDTAADPTTVLAPPTISTSFGAAVIPLNGSTRLTFTLANPNTTVALSGVGFTDTLPAGLVVATPNGLSGSCGGGTIAATAGAGNVALTGATLATSGSCSFAVTVTATTVGAKTNSTSAVVSTEGGPGLSASASVTVLAPDLTITKSHTGNFIQGDLGRTYTITVTNSGNAPTAGAVSVVDTLPASLTAAAIAGSGWNCTLATLTCTRGDSLVANASYPAIAVVVNVASNAPGTVVNSATVSGGSETNTANDTAADSTTINPITRFSVVAPGSATAGTAISFSVTAQDAFGNTATGYAGSLHFSSTDPQAGLPANTSLSNGVATLSATLKTAGKRTIVAADTVASSLTGESANITVAAALPQALTSTGGTSQSTVVNSGYSTVLQVTVKDAYGNPVVGVSVVFTAPPSGPSVTFVAASGTPGSSGPPIAPASVRRAARAVARVQAANTFTAITNAQGIASVGIVANQAEGNFSVTAAVLGLQTLFSLNNLPPPPLNPRVYPGFLQMTYKAGTDPSTAAVTLSLTAELAGSYSLSSAPAWLNVTPPSRQLPAAVTVRPDSAVQPGFYTNNLVFAFCDQSVILVPVQLSVYGPPELRSSYPALAFSAQAGSTAVQSQDIVVQVTAFNLPVTISAAAGGAWLTAASTATATPATVHVQVDPKGLAAGVYLGGVVATAAGASNTPFTIPVTFTITAGPAAITVTGIRNGASFAAGTVAPNTIVSAMGTFPGCTSGAQVTVDGAATTVFYSSPTQISFLAPPAVSNETLAQIQIACAGLSSSQTPVTIAPVSPALFTVPQNGMGQAVLVNQDGSTAAPSPAGSVIQLYGTGFGLFGASGADGSTWLASPVTASLGGVPATVLYAGVAPGFTSGLQQVDLLIPPGIAAGDAVPLQLTIGGVTTQPGLTLAIR